MDSIRKITIYFHIGFPKTATTTLQNYFFGYHPEINYLGRTNNKEHKFTKWLNRFTWLLREKNIDFFMNQGSSLAEEILTFIDTKDYSKVQLISFESVLSISMQPNSISHNTPFALDFNCILRKIQCLNCDLLFFRPIVTIRRQDELLHSYYAHYVNKFRKIKFLNSLNRYIYYLLIDGYYSLGGSLLNYYTLYNNLSTSFGTSNVQLMVYEDFREDPKFFLDRLAQFLCINPIFWLDQIDNQKCMPYDNNASISHGIKTATIFKGNLFTNLFWFKKWLFGDMSLGMGFLKPLLSKYNFISNIEVSLDKDVQKHILEKYKEGNKALDDKLKLGLNKFGYY